MAVVVGIVFVSAFLIFNVYFMIVVLESARTQSQNLTSDIATKATLIDSKKDIERVLAEQKSRADTVAKLFMSRMLVAPRLARLQDADFLPAMIQVTYLDYTTAARPSSRGKGSAIARVFKIDGFVRSPYSLDQDLRDDVRMQTLSDFVNKIENDKIFYDEFSGNVWYYKPIVREVKSETLYVQGKKDPLVSHSVPVYSFGLQAVSVFEETPAGAAQ